MFYQECLNPPIRGSIGTNTILALLSVKKSLNPPIRGSIVMRNVTLKVNGRKVSIPL